MEGNKPNKIKNTPVQGAGDIFEGDSTNNNIQEQNDTIEKIVEENAESESNPVEKTPEYINQLLESNNKVIESNQQLIEALTSFNNIQTIKGPSFEKIDLKIVDDADYVVKDDVKIKEGNSIYKSGDSVKHLDKDKLSHLLKIGSIIKVDL